MKLLERPYLAVLYDKCVLSVFISKRNMREMMFKIDAFGTLDKKAEYDIKIAKKRRKRSLDANAYAWVLIGKLAEALKESTTTVYRRIIADMSAFEIVPIRDDAVEKWITVWQEKGIGWLCEDMGACKNTQGYRNLKCHYGSSTFDSKEMSHFIDLIIQECKDQGIETLPPSELMKIKGLWGGKSG